MALLSQMFRTVAITGRTDTINAWFAGRQGGRWAEQTVGAAFPNVSAGRTRPPADAATVLREVTELQQRGVLTGVEAEALRARLGLGSQAAPDI
jgi:hypothetical protein